MDKLFFDTVYDRRNTGSAKYSDPPVKPGLPLISMWVADMDFRSPAAVAEALLKKVQHGIYGYGAADDEYIAVLSEWYSKKHGFDFLKKDFLYAPGVMFAAGAAVRALTKDGDAVMISQPVYPPFAETVKNCGRRLIVNCLISKNARYGFDFDRFEDQIVKENVKAYILCSPHNPVGRVWTKGELKTLTDICEKHSVYIISDEIHSDFLLNGAVHIPTATVSDWAAENTVSCISPSKTFNIAGLQIAGTVAKNKNINRLLKKETVRSGFHGPNMMALAAAKAAYLNGMEWLDALILYLEENFGIIKNALSESPISITPIEGTYLAWLDCRRLNISSEELVEFFLKEAGIWFFSGAAFGEGGDGFLRMNFACPKSVLTEALGRINEAVKRL